MSLAIISTHPIQYHAPVYRTLHSKFGIPVTVIYGSNFSVSGYRDPGFDIEFAWDTDLLSGYRSYFLSTVEKGRAKSFEEISARGLNRTLAKVAPKVVLLTGYRPRFHLWAFWYAWKARIPLLLRAEVTDHALARNRFKSEVRDLFLRWLYQQFAGLLYIGSRARKHYERLCVHADRIFFSPYCVDASTFQLTDEDHDSLRPRTRQELGISPESRVVLFSGKLTPNKRPDMLLTALQDLSADLRTKWGIIYMGDGPMRQALERQAGCTPELGVRFVGFQNQRALSRFYHAADVLALPSRFGETWGLVVNEALLHGLPCVVSDQVGCAPDLIEVGKTGEVFEAESASALQSALLRAESLVGRPETRSACKNQVAKYSVEEAAKGIAAAYRVAIGK